MYFIMFMVIASGILVAAIPIAFVIALLSPQVDNRLAPERNPALRGFAFVVAITVAGLMLLAVVASV